MTTYYITAVKRTWERTAETPDRIAVKRMYQPRKFLLVLNLSSARPWIVRHNCMRLSVTLVFLALLFTSPVVTGSEPPTTGEGLYEIGCAKCHGKTGTGVPLDQVGFDVPLPDLSDCSFATREPDFDWIAVSHQGGPVRGFDFSMPAFGEAFDVDVLPKDRRLHPHVLRR